MRRPITRPGWRHRARGDRNSRAPVFPRGASVRVSRDTALDNSHPTSILDSLWRLPDMHQQTGSLVQTLLGLPIFNSEWVLYLLLGSVGDLDRRDAGALDLLHPPQGGRATPSATALTRHLDRGDFAGAAAAAGEARRAGDQRRARGAARLREGAGVGRGPDRRGAGAREGPLREAAELPGHAGQQRALHRPVRHRAGHRALVPRPGGQHGRGVQRGHGRHRRGADRHRGRPAGGHPGGHRLQRVQGAGQGRGHQRPAAVAHPAGAAEVDGRSSGRRAE